MYKTLIIGRLRPLHSAVCEFCFDCSWHLLLNYIVNFCKNFSWKNFNEPFIYNNNIFLPPTGKSQSILMSLLIWFPPQLTSPVPLVHSSNLGSGWWHTTISPLRTWFGLPGFPSVSPFLPECSHTPHSVVISPQSPGVSGSFSSVFGFLYDFGSLKYWPVIPENGPSLGLFWLLSCHSLGLQQ